MRILILQDHPLYHYRIPIYNELVCNYKLDLTVAHPGKLIQNSNDMHFEEKIIKKNKLGFFYYRKGILKLCNNYNIIINMFNIRYIDTWRLTLLKKKRFKVINWGIGVTSAKGFDNCKKFDFIRYYLARKSDALLFYSEYPIKKYLKQGVDKSKLFIAHNTIKTDVEPSINIKIKDSFIFIGTINKRKKLSELILALKLLKYKYKKNIKLIIIGEGPEKKNIEILVKKLRLDTNVEFIGQIRDKKMLKFYFEKALATISPGQAGLSVLESFAFGVPFVTKKDAITGGELFNIINGETGFLYNGQETELVNIMNLILTDKEKALIMCNNALKHYKEKRNIKVMTDGFYNAISFVNSKKK